MVPLTLEVDAPKLRKTKLITAWFQIKVLTSHLSQITLPGFFTPLIIVQLWRIP